MVNFAVSAGTNLKVSDVTKENTDVEKTSFGEDISDLPKQFSWRNVNGTDFSTPVRNMYSIPACEAFALVAAVETMVQYEIGYPFGCDLSEAHLFFCSGGDCEWGVYMEDALSYLHEYGVPDEACWPYPKDKRNYPCNTSSPDWKNRTVRITDWQYLPSNRDVIKHELITNGPVVAYFDLYKDFFLYRRGIYQHRWGKPAGGHWIAIIGYNDNQGYWLCENSWGNKWGDGGYFKIKYGECSIDSHAISIRNVTGTFPIVYVDDDNTAGPWNGTKEYPYNYIQDAIDHAYEGYTVFVRNGTYYEHVLINKTINLDGENRSKTVIDGTGAGDVITISTDRVRISGLCIQNSGQDLFDAGIKIRSFPNAAQTIIDNNIIQNNKLGIYAYWSSWNHIKNNIIENNNDGIYLWGSYNNVIEVNQIQNNSEHGIEFEYSQSRISGNTIINNNESGIYLNEKSNANLISGKNTLKNNGIGIELRNSNGNVILRNNLIDNQQQAYFVNSYFNKWIRNHWNDWPKLIPRSIPGKIGKRGFPWLNFDLLPAKEPFEIS